jgi:hypothetical protein
MLSALWRRSGHLIRLRNRNRRPAFESRQLFRENMALLLRTIFAGGAVRRLTDLDGWSSSLVNNSMK